MSHQESRQAGMHAHNDSQQRAELRLAFLKHLPNRVENLARRARHFCESGWDINGLALLFEDIQRLAGAAGTHGALEVSQQLGSIEAVLDAALADEVLPDAASNERLIALLEALAPVIPVPTTRNQPATSGNNGAGSSLGQATDSTRVEMPPASYWRRWSSDATPPVPIRAPSPAAITGTISSGGSGLGVSEAELEAALAAGSTSSLEIVSSSVLADTTTGAAPAAASANRAPATVVATAIGRPAGATPAASEPARPRVTAAEVAAKAAAAVSRNSTVAKPPVTPAPAAKRPVIQTRASGRIYHLSDSSALSVELDQQLETIGYELELLESADELKEVLAALPPDLVIVDASFVGDIEDIGPVLKSTRERTSARLLLMVLSMEDSVPVRLAARRAGADALLIKPRNIEEVIAKLQSLMEGSTEETYRILIVEDDRSQALFAESILRNAGMEARVVLEAFEVLKAMEEFQPDMVLMDLYMPDCDGTELTALIREREEFLQTPIVFLSGESDVDKHYDALEAGGDDFLSKPIRPKHLIAAVSNRIKRARALQRKVAERDPRDPRTGLYFRSHVLDRLSELLAAAGVRDSAGGILFIDLDGLPQLREKLGLSGIERLLTDTAQVLVGALGDNQLATRFSDGGFIVLCPDLADAELEMHAVALRVTLASHAFDIEGRPVRLRPSIGICALRFGFADAGAVLNAAERLSREARANERGVRSFEPPKRSEQTQADAMVATIRKAIERDSFELLYQPIVAVQGGNESQYQTLVRLRDDNGTLLAAGQFLPIAESHDLIVDIDRWVLAQAMRVIDMRRAEGLPVKLFVNQSASTLVTPDQADWVIAQLKTRGVPGASLVIELTLDNVEAHVEAVQTFCNRLVPLGVGFCLSRLESGDIADLVLERLPVSFIKLAPKYVSNSQSQALKTDLAKLVDRAHRKGLMVVAQRVEDAQAAATLWMSGIDFIQGNLVQPADKSLAFDFQAAVL
jgi:diguanylate cyclase (GGDEF)-like protein